MKKLLALLINIALIQIASATQYTLDFSGDNYLGHIKDGIPASPSDEVTYINYLITLGPGASGTQIPAGTGEVYDRIGSILAGSFPTAVETGSKKYEDPATGTISDIAFQYVLGKYDADNPGAGAYVWYFPQGTLQAGDTIVVPMNSPQVQIGIKPNGTPKYGSYGLSHISLFNPGDSVPDGGTTVTLLGFGLLALGGLRRRFAK